MKPRCSSFYVAGVGLFVCDFVPQYVVIYEHIRKFNVTCVCISAWAGSLSRHNHSIRLDGGLGIESQWRRFSAPVQTGPATRLASYTMGIGPFPGVKRPGRGVNHPLPSSAEVEKE